MKIKLINQKGKELEKQVELESSVFEAKVNDALEVQALRVYNYNQRAWSAKAQTRSEVHGGGRKPFPQKGTGRARQGSSRSPVNVGGSTTFGPRPKNGKKLSLSKKMTKAAIRSSLSRKVKGSSLKILEKLELPAKPSTKAMIEILSGIQESLNVAKHTANRTKGLFIVDKSLSEVKKSAGNLKNVTVLYPEAINIFELSKADFVVLTADALDTVNKVWKVRKANESK